MGKGGKVYRNPRAANRGGPEELLFGLAGSVILVGIVGGIMRLGATLDCGTLMPPPHGITDPFYSPPELIELMRECEISEPNEYWMRSSIIQYNEGPCRFSHYREIYPAPECKRGDEARMVLWERKEWADKPTGTANPWNISVRTLCCSVQKDLENDAQQRLSDAGLQPNDGGGTA